MFVVTFEETERREVSPPEPIYKEEWWGPKNNKWLMRYVSNDPYTTWIRIKGKRYIDGVYMNDYIQYIPK